MKKLEKIIIGSQNPAKKERYKSLLADLTEEILILADIGIDGKPDETGKTAEENAELKSRFYAEKISLPVFSEDAALYVDFLPDDKQPGVNVRRVDGKKEVSDERLLEYWEKILVNIPTDKMTGKWHFAYSLAMPDKKIKTVSFDLAICFFSPSSKIKIPGWPMSSLQGPMAFGKPHSELTKDEKHQLDNKIDKIISEKLKNLFSVDKEPKIS